MSIKFSLPRRRSDATLTMWAAASASARSAGSLSEESSNMTMAPAFLAFCASVTAPRDVRSK